MSRWYVGVAVIQSLGSEETLITVRAASGLIASKEISIAAGKSLGLVAEKSQVHG